MTCTHVFWRVSATDRQRTITRARGRGRHRKTFEDIITVTVVARSFWVQEEAFRYCRENGIPIRCAKLSFGTMSMT